MVCETIEIVKQNFTLIFLSFCHAIISVFLGQGVESAQKQEIKIHQNIIEAFTIIPFLTLSLNRNDSITR